MPTITYVELLIEEIKKEQEQLDSKGTKSVVTTNHKKGCIEGLHRALLIYDLLFTEEEEDY